MASSEAYMADLDRLEALFEKVTEVDWGFDELVMISTALPDLLILARYCQDIEFECDENRAFPLACREIRDLSPADWCMSCRAAAAKDALLGQRRDDG